MRDTSQTEDLHSKLPTAMLQDSDESVIDSQLRKKSPAVSPRSPRMNNATRARQQFAAARMSGQLSPRTTTVDAQIDTPKRPTQALVTYIDGVYFSSHGPDELPGLRAWTLVSKHM